MRSGLPISLGLHALIGAALIVSLPSFSREKPQDLIEVPVEILTISETPNPPPGVKPEYRDETKPDDEQTKAKSTATDGGKTEAPKPEVVEKKPEPPPVKKAEVPPEPPQVKPEPKPPAPPETKPEPKKAAEPPNPPEKQEMAVRPPPPEPPKAEPKPEPPKPEVKPEPKKEEAKPAESRPQIASRPETKPEAPPEPAKKAEAAKKPEAPVKRDSKAETKDKKSADFDSALKSADNLRKAKREDNKDENARPQPAGAPQANRAAPLSGSEIDAIRRKIRPCWNFPAGARDQKTLIVKIHVWLERDASVRDAKVLDTARYGRDAAFRAAADAGMRAIKNPRCSPLPVDPAKYERWKWIEFVFDPNDI